jgi:5'-3' exonuclease
MLLTKFKNNKLIIDTSYLMHYKANSAFSWFKNEFAGDLPYIESRCADYDFTQDAEYIEHYTRNFMFQVEKIAASFQCRLRDTIFAVDCKRSEIWRKDLYPEYKANRDKAKDPKYPSLSPVFGYTKDFILPKIESDYGIRSIHVDRAEADDVIAVIAKYWSNVDKDNVLICANDMDISQLCDDSINMVGLDGLDIRTKMRDKFDNGDRLIEHKALSGDRGDNIPSVKFRKMGDKTAMKCLDNPQMLVEFFEKHPDAVDRYELNKELVDLKYIPKDIQREILTKYLVIESERNSLRNLR